MSLKNLKTINYMYWPAMALFIGIVFYPFLHGIRISFTDWNGFSQNFNYVGFNNYKSLFLDANFYMAFKNTLIYGLGSTLFQQVLGLSYALLLNRDFKGRNLLRAIIYLPVLISGLIMGYMWYFIFQYSDGALNDILLFFNLEPRDWLGNPSYGVWIIVAVNTLQYCGVSMIIYLAGLQSISKSYYEAANIDGASTIQQFKYITLPLLKPAIITSFTLNLIGGLKLFDTIKALTNGGPGYASNSLSTLINVSYFRSQMAGYASSMGLVLFIFIVSITIIIQKKFTVKEGEL
ncbi:carbohydrate ABC transporter permease [Cetobacterium sp.]|uniref:carbohydrate ABC transporter permease n=1 Tax=Cetobacterium sp. TaxID=2071632 RepID=UPI0025F24646|nr:sugar ABC transporter permease [uncultured Cetobacterium sp.]